MISHTEAQALISARLDQPLDPIADRALSDHVAICSECRAFAHASDSLAMGLRELPYLPASPTVSRGVMARIEQGRSPWARLGGLLDINPMPALSTFAVVAVLFLLGFFVLNRFVLDDTGEGEGNQQVAVQPTAQPTQSFDFVATETPIPTDTPAPTETTTTAPTETSEPTPEPTETSEPTPAPTETTEPTPESTATVPPTETPEPTATTEPTPEPTATTPPPTQTPAPTATTEPTPEPTATSEPEPTATDEPQTMQARGGAGEDAEGDVVDLTGDTSTEDVSTGDEAAMDAPTATTAPAPEPTATSEPEPTATTAPTPEPTATKPAPTETPVPTETPAPSPTPEPTEETAPPIVPIDGSDPIEAPEDAATDPEDAPTARGSAGDETGDAETTVAIEPMGGDDDASTEDSTDATTDTATTGDVAETTEKTTDAETATDTATAQIEPIGELTEPEETETGTETETVTEIDTDTGTDTDEEQTPVVEEQTTEDVRDLGAASQPYGNIAGDPSGRLLLESGRMEYGTVPHGASLVTEGGYEAQRAPVDGGESVAICPPGGECTPLSHLSADGPVADEPLGWTSGGVVYVRATSDGVSYRFLVPTDDGTAVVSDEVIHSGGTGDAPTASVFRTEDRLWVITQDGSWLSLGPGGGQDLGGGGNGASLVRFAPTTQRLLLGYVKDGALNIADASQPGSPFLRLPFSGRDFDIAPGGQEIVVSEGNAIAIYDIGGTLLTRYEGEGMQPGTVLWLNSGIVYHDEASGVLMTIPETARG